MTWLQAFVAAAVPFAGGYYLGVLRRPRAAGIRIKLRHQVDAGFFIPGDQLNIDEPVALALGGKPVAGGTFEGTLRITTVDHADGSIIVEGGR